MLTATAGQIARATGVTRQAIQKRAQKEGWTFAERNGRKLYLGASLPIPAAANEITQDGIDALGLGGGESPRARWAKASAKERNRARQKLKAVDLYMHHRASGLTLREAAAATREATGDSTGSITTWATLVKDHPREDWPALLLNKYVCKSKPQACHTGAEEWFISAMRGHTKRDATFCYDLLVEQAKRHPEWGTLPSYRSMLRRYRRAVSRTTRVLHREGEKAFDRLFPRVSRDKTGLLPLEVLTGDGRDHDVMVRWPASRDGVRYVGRPTALVWQDVCTGTIVGWALGQTENWNISLLALHDAIADWGVPDELFVDNGHAFMAKAMTAGATTKRYRFKDKPGDAPGILKGLDINVVPAAPGHPWVKDIESAFGHLAERIDKHPRCERAYLGNKPSARQKDYDVEPIDFDEFREVFVAGIEWWNTQAPARTLACQGRPRLEVFRELLTARAERGVPPRRLTQEQLRCMLMPTEGGKKIAKVGATVTLHGSRYHAPEMLERTGEQVDLRYDPDDLSSGVWVFAAGSLDPFCRALPVGVVRYRNEEERRVADAVRRVEVKAERDKAKARGRIHPRDLVTRGNEAAPKKRPPPVSNVVAPNFGAKVNLSKAEQAITARFRAEEEARFRAELAKQYAGVKLA